MLKTIQTIRFLLDELEAEVKYADEYDVQVQIAKEKSEKIKSNHWGYWEYLPEKYRNNSPKGKASIKRKAMVIRELCLKLYKED